MSYSTDADLDNAFGKINVDKWANADNTLDETEILARREWAREQAHDELNSRLADAPYAFPITGTPPPLLVRIETYLACMLLSESRTITDTDEDPGDLKSIAKRVERFINGIKLGTIKLTGLEKTAATEAPFVVNDFPQIVDEDAVSWFDSYYKGEWG